MADGVVAERSPRLLIVFVVAARLAILLAAGEHYGYMSDELYFMDAGRHLAAGYVDFPPLIAWLMAALQQAGLDSIFALRTVAALLGLAVTLLGVDLCRLLGGGGFARWLTALVLLFAPGFLAVQSILTMNGLDQLWWLAAFWLMARYLQAGGRGPMLALGVVLGLGVLSKLSILALCAAGPLALLVWQPSVWRRSELWFAALIAVAIASPFLAWQLAGDFPFVDFIRAYNSSPPRALVLQHPLLGMLLTMNPGYAVIWGAGALYCLLAPDRRLRLLGTACWLCLALFVLAGVKFYFAVPVFALFTVAGALLWERVARRPLRVGLLLLGLSGAVSVPAAAPVLPDAQLQRLADFLRDGEQGYPGTEPASLERYFPHFAEMHGWPQLVELTAELWDSLAPAERDGAVLVASYYGQSAALNLLDRDNRLPTAYGRHMSYHLWSRGLDYSHGLFVGFEATELRPLFNTVEERGRLFCRGCMSRENGLRIFYVAGPRLPAADIHARLRRYDFF